MRQLTLFNVRPDKAPRSDKIYRKRPEEYDDARTQFKLYFDYGHWRNVYPPRMLQICKEYLPHLEGRDRNNCLKLIKKLSNNV